MKYSILFFNYDPEEKLSDMTKDTLYRIVKNSRGQEYELLVFDRKGIEREQNRALKTARGEYLIFFCNDMVLSDPEWLQKLANPGVITSWRASVSNWGFKELDFSLICFPRDIADKIGEFDTAYEGAYGYSDNDYLMRAHLLGIPFNSVNIQARHLENQTFKVYPLEPMERNRAYFSKKFNLNI